MHQAIGFAIASAFDCQLPFARNFRSEDEILPFRSQNDSHSPLANAFATLNLLSFFVLIWFRKFPSKFAGRVKTRIRIRSCIAVTVARSGPEGGTNGPIRGTYRAPAKVWPLFHCTKPSFNCTLASYGSNCRGSRKSLKKAQSIGFGQT